ncbi:MAG: cache domain-containing protein [Deltaproteobacteria bacterium]|nr:cache domain-containing protein [Deltaproteobacteria bacterium]
MSLSKSISTEHAKAPWLYRIPYPIVVIFIIFAVCLFALGIVYHRYRISEQIEEYQGILNSISSLKTQQIVRWKKERLGDALAVLMTPIMRQAVAAYLRNPKSRHLSDQILTTMRIMRSAYEYEDIDLADSSLNILLTTASQATACPDLLHAAAAQAEKERAPHFTDFHRSTTGRIHFSMIVPFFEGLESTSSAFFIVAIDPYAVLYPLIQSVPIDSDSLETLLVRREGDDVVFLNELRHQKNTALQLRFPLAKTALPAAMTVLGKEGFVRGFDYRGIKVMALVLAIPDTPWFMVAKSTNPRFSVLSVRICSKQWQSSFC